MAKMLESVPAEIQKGLPTKQAETGDLHWFAVLTILLIYSLNKGSLLLWINMDQPSAKVANIAGILNHQRQQKIQHLAATCCNSANLQAQIDWDAFHFELLGGHAKRPQASVIKLHSAHSAHSYTVNLVL